MNPTGTDLLDIFNSRPKKGSSPARATSRPRESRSGGSGGGFSDGGSSGPGSFGRGRLFLGGTVMVLLLALAFTAGVGVGRTRRGVAPAAPEAPPLAAVRDSWGLRSKTLPNVGSNANSLRTRSLAEIYRRWPDLQGRTYVADVVDKSQKPTGQFKILLKDFDTRLEAQQFVNEISLWQMDGLMPFDGCRPERMPPGAK